MVAAAWNKVSAWEKGEGIREASQVMTRASSLLGRGERLLVRKTGRFLHNVPALERSALFCRETGRFLHNVPAWEKSACFRRWGIKESRRSGACPSRLLSQAGTLFQPNSPKPRRCARSRGISGSDGRFSPKPGPCSSRILPSKDVVHDRGEFLPLSAVSLPSRDDVPLQLSQAGTLRREAAYSPLRQQSFSRAGTLIQHTRASSLLWRRAGTRQGPPLPSKDDGQPWSAHCLRLGERSTSGKSISPKTS